MANCEWNVPFTLTSPQGNLDLNAGSGDRYVLVPSKCSMGLSSVRVEADDVPQGDGGIIHRSFRGHYVVRLGLQFWVGGDVSSSVPACLCDRKRMLDTLRLHQNALVEPATLDADVGLTRLLWEPSDCNIGDDRRMVNRIKLLTGLEDGAVTDDGEGAVEATMSFICPYPYAMDVTLTTTTLGAVNVAVTNLGNTDFYPVFKIYGECGSFTITNVTTDKAIIYNGALPGALPIGAGEYAEISTFDNSVNLVGGSGGNLQAGVDPTVSEFWTLVPGENVVHIGSDTPGTTGEMLWNNSWV